ncbi:hypothetical protein L3X38_039684 [Prunus dulcis]|uniref:TNase-like domain-containing protein n=1 Tax=Prunus dulcis TaxID=3755 RepID=A0AAD4V8V4_PRUDU|nr:hypothetical protein L3X38_039684 [Prunus dulcis]
MMTINEKRELTNAYYEAKEGRSIVGKDYEAQYLIGTVVNIVSRDHIIVAVAEQEYEVYLSSIRFPKLGGDGVLEPEAYADEAKDFVRAHLIGRQVHVQLEYSRKSRYGSVFLGSALDSRNVSELVVDTVLGRNDIEVTSNYYDACCTVESSAILNKKAMHSGVDPPVIIDLSNATWKEVGKACDNIFVWAFDEYEKVEGFVESVIRTNSDTKDKIILLIQRNKKTWKIAFSLYHITWPRGEEPYADEAFELLRQTLFHKRVEVLLETIDSDGYFMGALLESNTHVAIPLLKAGLAKLEPGPSYHVEFCRAQDSAITKKLKIWENNVEPYRNYN